MRRRRHGLGTGCLIAGIALVCAAPASAAPTSIVVTSAADSGAGTLRDAINQANANSNPDGTAITFSGNLTILPTTPLPTITRKTSIDGSAHTVEIDAVHQASGDGLTIDGPGSVIRGMAIDDAPGNGITLGPGSDGSVIGGAGAPGQPANFIGTTKAAAAKPNGGWGIAVTAGSGSAIGVPSTSQFANVIENNFAGGVLVKAPASGDPVLNSIIESNRGSAGIQIDGSLNNVVGGLPAGAAGSLIAFNTGDAVNVRGGQAGGNQIAGNTLTLNSGAGVNLAGSGDDNQITQNSISGNTGLGITLLGTTTPKPNVASNPGPAPNQSQNYPVITGVDTGTKTITGTLNSAPNSSFTVELYNSASCDSSGFGQGSAYLGSTTVTTDASGDGAFTFVSTSGLQTVTATATDPSGDTSEFSQCFPQFAGPHITLSVVQLSFGDQGVGTTSPVAFVNAKNTGSAKTSLSSSALSGSSEFSRDPGNSGSAPSCSDGMSLNPGDSCDFGLQFAPSQAGPATGQLDATFTGTKPLTVQLSGNGVTNNLTPPTITGTPIVGKALKSTDGTWSGSPQLSRKWKRCDPAGANCKGIGGATGAKYTVVKADAGHTLRLVVTASNSGGSAASAQTAVVPTVPNTKVSKTTINHTEHTATFNFNAVGTATGFQCKLRRNHSSSKSKWETCASPQTYMNLKKGRYTFLVRAVNGMARDPSPVQKSFRIP